jgi:hypothetical protein
MTIGLLFWILFIVGLVFYGIGVVRTREYEIPGILFWVLIFLLGWAQFGAPIK